MAIIRAGYKRTFQTRPYETQVVELSIEDDVGAVAQAECYRMLRGTYVMLQAMGNDLMAEALAQPDSRDLPASSRPSTGSGAGVRPGTPRPPFPPKSGGRP